MEAATDTIPVLYSELTLLEQLTRRRDALIAAAKMIPVAVVDPDDDPVLCNAKRQLLEAAGRLFLQIQRLERNADV